MKKTDDMETKSEEKGIFLFTKTRKNGKIKKKASRYAAYISIPEGRRAMREKRNIFKWIYISLCSLYVLLVLLLAIGATLAEERGSGGFMQMGFGVYLLLFATILAVFLTLAVCTVAWVQNLIAFRAKKESGKVFLLTSLSLVFLCAAALSVLWVILPCILVAIGIGLGIAAAVFHRRER